ncbi:MAG TPA: RNA polymerase sigma factor [bacterium]|nr:RNA polymerase sigma factor [bacterium]
MADEVAEVVIDAALIRRCQEGDRGAFRDVYEHFKNKVYSTAFRFTNNHEEAADLTQDIFLNIYKKVGMFEFKSSFSTWVYRLSVNMSIDRIRKLRRYSVTSMDDPGFKETGDYGKVHREHQMEAPGDAALSGESADKMQKAIARLTPKLRTVVVMRYINDLPYHDIAQILKCSEGTIKSRLNRAHMKLKEIMEKEV